MGKKIARIILVTFLALIIFMGAVIFLNPVGTVKKLIAGEKYDVLKTYYNMNLFSSEKQTEINALIADQMNDILNDWRGEECSDEEAEKVFKTISELNNESISKMAEDNIDYINIENKGDEAFAEAEKYYQSEDYVSAMRSIKSIDRTYSLFGVAEDLYTECKKIIILDDGHPSTAEEYEKVIEQYENYYTEFGDSEFQNKKNALENEYTEYKAIYKVLTKATSFYEKQNYKQSFKTIEKGLRDHPNNKAIEYALSAYQYAYILTISEKVVDLTETEKYDEAQVLLEKAIDVYDCAEFQELLEQVKLKSDLLYAVKANLFGFGDYIYRSSKKFILGDYAEDEQHTLLSLGGTITAAVTNVDAPLDIRDLSYDMSHWGQGDYFAARLALDVVSILPVIGAIKYVKHIDELSDTAKVVGDVADTAHDVANAADSADDIADSFKSGKKLFDVADIIKDVKKTSLSVADVLDDTNDVAKKSDTVSDIADITSDHFTFIKTYNQGLLGKTHPETGVRFVLSKVELSDGSKIKGVFPEFDSYITVDLPKEYYKVPFNEQKKYLSQYLKTMSETEDGMKILKKSFDADQIKEISQGIIPEGFVWHHNEREGVMQLVDAVIHQKTNHTGGMSIWGAGY